VLRKERQSFGENQPETLTAAWLVATLRGRTTNQQSEALREVEALFDKQRSHPSIGHNHYTIIPTELLIATLRWRTGDLNSALRIAEDVYRRATDIPAFGPNRSAPVEAYQLSEVV